MTKLYPVIYEWSGKNLSGYSPDVAGCMATAKTLNVMRSSLAGALEAHLQGLANEGDPLPEPSERVTVDMEPDSEFPQPRGYYVIVERLEITVPKPKSVRSQSVKALKAKAKPVVTKRRSLQAA